MSGLCLSCSRWDMLTGVRNCSSIQRAVAIEHVGMCNDYEKSLGRNVHTVMCDPVDHPSHYTSSPAKCECGRTIECIQVTQHMNFCTGGAVKYLWRKGLKGGPEKELEDLRKARKYLDFEIKRLEEQNK